MDSLTFLLALIPSVLSFAISVFYAYMVAIVVDKALLNWRKMQQLTRRKSSEKRVIKRKDGVPIYTPPCQVLHATCQR